MSRGDETADDLREQLDVALEQVADLEAWIEDADSAVDDAQDERDRAVLHLEVALRSVHALRLGIARLAQVAGIETRKLPVLGKADADLLALARSSSLGWGRLVRQLREHLEVENGNAPRDSRTWASRPNGESENENARQDR